MAGSFPSPKFKNIVLDNPLPISSGGTGVDTPEELEALFSGPSPAELVANGPIKDALDTKASTAYTDGDTINPLSRPAVFRDRELLFLKDETITGNGTSDDADALQRILEKAERKSQKLIVPGNIEICAKEPVVAYDRLNMEGEGFDWFQATNAGGQWPNGHGRGSLFIFDHLGVGLMVTNPGPEADPPSHTYRQGNIIKNVCFSRKQTTPVPGTIFNPINADYDLVMKWCGGLIDNVQIMGSTNGIKLINPWGMTVRNLHGQAMKTMLNIPNSYDVNHIFDFHSTTGWCSEQSVKDYAVANSKGISLGRVDNIMMDQIFGTSIQALLHYYRFNDPVWASKYSPDGHGVAWNTKAGLIEADNSKHLILVDAGCDKMSLKCAIAGGYGAPEGTAPDSIFVINGDNNKFHFGSLFLSNSRGSLAYVNPATQGNTVHCGVFEEGTWNGFNGGANQYPAIAWATGANVNNPNRFTIGQWERRDLNSLQYSPFTPGGYGASSAVGNVSGCYKKGKVQVQLTASGTLTIAHNTGMIPDGIRITHVEGGGTTPVGRYFQGSKTANSFDMRIYDQQSGTLLTSAITNNFFDIYYELHKELSA